MYTCIYYTCMAEDRSQKTGYPRGFLMTCFGRRHHCDLLLLLRDLSEQNPGQHYKF